MGLELADLFRAYGADYRKKYADKLLPSHRQAMWAIESCRTERLGGQVFGCSNCQEFQYSYHSCRNRNCPKCQHELTQNWLKVQQELLLNVPYFFLTFTLPSELRNLVRANQKALYSLLFQASAEATQKLALDPRYIGGQIGLVGVLHTWTRNLIYHPHVHYLAPGGGLHSDGQTWLPSQHGFFLPVPALSKLFRAAFRRGLEKLKLFDQVPSRVWTKKWVVNCKPVADGQAALK
jgi:Transposase zinc-binding domain/Putative transposase